MPMVQEPLIPLQASDRLFATGRTGSGKTTMCKVLLRRVQRFAVLDPKHMFYMRGVPINTDFDANKNRQIIRLPRGAPRALWDDIAGRIYDEGDIILYVDEWTGVLARDFRRLPDNFDWAVRTGREHNVGVWGATQYPTYIPSNIFSETDHFLIFNLAMKQHKVKMSEMTTDEILPILMRGKRDPTHMREHDFIYYHVKGKYTIVRSEHLTPSVKREELRMIA